jgi:hypothetical protein
VATFVAVGVIDVMQSTSVGNGASLWVLGAHWDAMLFVRVVMVAVRAVFMPVMIVVMLIVIMFMLVLVIMIMVVVAFFAGFVIVGHGSSCL